MTEFISSPSTLECTPLCSSRCLKREKTKNQFNAKIDQNVQNLVSLYLEETKKQRNQSKKATEKEINKETKEAKKRQKRQKRQRNKEAKKQRDRETKKHRNKESLKQ